MAKVSIRIPLYTNSPDKMLKLARDVSDQHDKLGASSPMNSNSLVDMADFKTKVEQAEALRAEAEAHYAEYKIKMEEARNIMGISAGLSINHEGKLYFMLDVIKKWLLLKNHSEEKNLEQWGFHVVVRNAVGVGRPRKR